MTAELYYFPDHIFIRVYSTYLQDQTHLPLHMGRPGPYQKVKPRQVDQRRIKHVRSKAAFGRPIQGRRLYGRMSHCRRFETFNLPVTGDYAECNPKPHPLIPNPSYRDFQLPYVELVAFDLLASLYFSVPATSTFRALDFQFQPSGI